MGSIDARLHRDAADHVTMNTTIHVSPNTELPKAPFEQTLPCRQKN
jgi:hypothetical protein